MRHAKTLQFIAMLAVLGSLAVPASTAGAQSRPRRPHGPRVAIRNRQ